MQRILGRVAKSPEDDPIINLLIGMVKRAQLDLVATRRKGRNHALPSNADRETAAEFLREVTESARRHLSHGTQRENREEL